MERSIVGVMGPGTHEHDECARPLGELIATVLGLAMLLILCPAGRAQERLSERSYGSICVAPVKGTGDVREHVSDSFAVRIDFNDFTSRDLCLWYKSWYSTWSLWDAAHGGSKCRCTTKK
jgi:hypothetical protein